MTEMTIVTHGPWFSSAFRSVFSRTLGLFLAVITQTCEGSADVFIVPPKRGTSIMAHRFIVSN